MSIVIETKLLKKALDAVRGWAGDVVVEWTSRNEPVVFRTGKIVKIIMPMNLENRR